MRGFGENVRQFIPRLRFFFFFKWRLARTHGKRKSQPRQIPRLGPNVLLRIKFWQRFVIEIERPVSREDHFRMKPLVSILEVKVQLTSGCNLTYK